MVSNHDLVPQDDGFYIYEAVLTAQFDIVQDDGETKPKWSKHKLLITAATIDEAKAKAEHCARYLTERDMQGDGAVVNFRITGCVVSNNVGSL